ncbi:hypothetical protein SAMN04488074_110150 [Lentzea albidocapillata subsp. violacea]|uniref:Uncharacterized protein n=1 Tax=Lentzea albidocapillata subsp. violacea TaxID=128104 RepID=A0A1G9J6S9_9PSEU|nr:hypothetical protein SAMN04488074_110150 [Lentzea albidocapillata subsp. violacea]
MTTSNWVVRQQLFPPAVGARLPRLPPGAGMPERRSVVPIEWFRRMPNGGTVYLRSPR